MKRSVLDGGLSSFTNVDVSSMTRGQEGGEEHVNAKSPVVWNTEKINHILEMYADGEVDLKGMKGSPFSEGDPDYRKPGVVFQYTKEEKLEWDRCASDPLYFAENYAYAMTDDGLQLLKYRDYQRSLMQGFHNNRYSILLASRQIGKTITSATYLVWFVLFHKQKNALVVGDVWDTTKELIEKMQNIIKNLPFFLKPGIKKMNEKLIKLENESRVIGRTTTKKTGIGFNIHLLYMDEFAHIDPSFLNYFYRSIYPTISGMKNSKVIITSTPNGTNRFFTLWRDAIEGKNGYHPMRVDWWQVEGRDEAWKQETIANLGSEEDFNQEYGLQFFAGDNLLLNSTDIKKINVLKRRYEVFNWDILMREEDDYREYLKFHPNFVKSTLSDSFDLRNDKNRYVMSIDMGEGIGKDYSVLNIFKVINRPLNILQKHRPLIKDHLDVFGIIQVGTFRTNKMSVDKFGLCVNDLLFRFFNTENVTVALELNHDGKIIHSYLKSNSRYTPDMMIHTKHTQSSKFTKPGIIMNSNKAKTDACENFKYLVTIDKILANEFQTVEELGGFGRVGNSSLNKIYRSQSGNDDMAMTSIHTSFFFGSPHFYEMCDDLYDEIPDAEYVRTVERDFIEYNRKIDGQGSGMDASTVSELNSMM